MKRKIKVVFGWGFALATLFLIGVSITALENRKPHLLQLEIKQIVVQKKAFSLLEESEYGKHTSLREIREVLLGIKSGNSFFTFPDSTFRDIVLWHVQGTLREKSVADALKHSTYRSITPNEKLYKARYTGGRFLSWKPYLPSVGEKALYHKPTKLLWFSGSTWELLYPEKNF
ncbi:MAG TPA: hypothetical protein VLB02_03030 [Candidatus Paceibacterota bacterium]|nr:hypothetical protein [Candidatus Paceibacterota bacterium]